MAKYTNGTIVTETKPDNLLGYSELLDIGDIITRLAVNYLVNPDHGRSFAVIRIYTFVIDGLCMTNVENDCYVRDENDVANINRNGSKGLLFMFNSYAITQYYESIDRSDEQQLMDYHNYCVKMINEMLKLMEIGINPQTKRAN